MLSFAALIASTVALLSFAGSAVAQSDTSADEGKRLFSGYIPELWAAVLGLVLFGVVGAYHWMMWFRCGRQKYLLTLTIGMTCMTFGFVLRLVYRSTPYSLGLYAMQLMFILLSPCAFLATDYLLLKHLAIAMGPEVVKDCLFLPIRVIVKLFVWCDVITFWIQGGGGGLSAERGKIAEIGPKIALVGLIIQLVSFGLFTLLLIVFAYRVRTRFPHLGSPIPAFSFRRHNPWSRELVNDWRILFWVLLLSCVGIFIRCTFRTVEYAQGYSGYLITHEIYFYLLDALPLFLAMSLYAYVWPALVVDSAAENQSTGALQTSLEAGHAIGPSPTYSIEKSGHAGAEQVPMTLHKPYRG
ncbi:hypothetical protein JCM8547_007835 [Rhodosporidiobolus lusitaniae]